MRADIARHPQGIQTTVFEVLPYGIVFDHRMRFLPNSKVIRRFVRRIVFLRPFLPCSPRPVLRHLQAAEPFHGFQRIKDGNSKETRKQFKPITVPAVPTEVVAGFVFVGEGKTVAAAAQGAGTIGLYEERLFNPCRHKNVAPTSLRPPFGGFKSLSNCNFGHRAASQKRKEALRD